jgi:hypothetical protein
MDDVRTFHEGDVALLLLTNGIWGALAEALVRFAKQKSNGKFYREDEEIAMREGLRFAVDLGLLKNAEDGDYDRLERGESITPAAEEEFNRQFRPALWKAAGIGDEEIAHRLSGVIELLGDELDKKFGKKHRSMLVKLRAELAEVGNVQDRLRPPRIVEESNEAFRARVKPLIEDRLTLRGMSKIELCRRTGLSKAGLTKFFNGDGGTHAAKLIGATLELDWKTLIR